MIHRMVAFAAISVFAVMVAATGIAGEFKIGDMAPNFTAIGVDGKEYTLKAIVKKTEAVVVCLTCNQCPVAVAYEDRMIEFAKEYKKKGIIFLALNCNNKTEDLDAMKQRAEEKGFNFIYAFDQSGDAARYFGAKVTPEFFLLSDGKLTYHGAFDDDMKNPTKSYLVDAVEAVLAGETPEIAKTKAFGCGIKLKQ